MGSDSNLFLAHVFVSLAEAMVCRVHCPNTTTHSFAHQLAQPPVHPFTHSLACSLSKCVHKQTTHISDHDTYVVCAAGYFYNSTDLVARAHDQGLQLHPYTFR